MTLTLPPRMTAGSGMDALSHVVEALMSTQANPLSDALSLEAASLVFENLRRAYHHGEDLEARWGMSLAATLGGWVIGFPWIAGPATIGLCIAEQTPWKDLKIKTIVNKDWRSKSWLGNLVRQRRRDELT